MSTRTTRRASPVDNGSGRMRAGKYPHGGQSISRDGKRCIGAGHHRSWSSRSAEYSSELPSAMVQRVRVAFHDRTTSGNAASCQGGAGVRLRGEELRTRRGGRIIQTGDNGDPLVNFSPRQPDNPKASPLSAWLMVMALVAAVALLAILPYVGREATLVLGRWILLAPALAVTLAATGGFALYQLFFPHRSAMEESIKRSPGWAGVVLLSALFVAALANLVAVAVLWLAQVPRPPASSAAPVPSRADLAVLAANPDMQLLGHALVGSAIPASPQLRVLEPFIRGSLRDVSCDAHFDPSDATVTREFVCTMPAVASPSRPACELRWSVTPIFEANGSSLAVIGTRDDVVTKFSSSGYGMWAVSGKPSTLPSFVGVAFVACEEGKLPSPITSWNLRVAFVVDSAEEVAAEGHIFRTVGFDWIARSYFQRPYLAEVFALASLHSITGLIRNDQVHFVQGLRSLAKDDVLSDAALRALRSRPASMIHVANRSDSQLGNSRGSCLLAAEMLGTSPGVSVHVAPSAITRDLPTADRSLVVFSAGHDPISVPCSMVSALVTRDMSGAVGYPTALSGGSMQIYSPSGLSSREVQRRGYNIRAAALTLYLLGFSVSYSPARNPDIVAGLWPRAEHVLVGVP